MEPNKKWKEDKMFPFSFIGVCNYVMGKKKRKSRSEWLLVKRRSDGIHFEKVEDRFPSCAYAMGSMEKV